MQLYRTILADPPWRQTLTGRYKRRQHGTRFELPYPTMTVEQVKAMPVANLAADGCHLWLWTTNEFLQAGFDVMAAWGFKYLAPVHWKKPSGCGNYFIHLTQTLLFGYRGKCVFNKARFVPNWFEALPGEHSAKPKASYDLIESVSEGPYLELFARPVTPMFPKLPHWHVWGNEVQSDVSLSQPSISQVCSGASAPT